MMHKGILAISVSAITFAPLSGVELKVTPGSVARHLSSLPSGEGEIVMKGEIDARDFPAFAGIPSSVTSLDMSGVTLVECAMPVAVAGERSYYAAGELPEYLFFETSLKRVSLPSNVVTLPAGLFASSSVERVSLPAGVVEISPYAFYGCSRLETFEAPSGLRKVGEMAFAGCAALRDVRFPSGVVFAGREIFAGSGLVSADFSGVSEYAGYSLSGINSLREVSLNPDGVVGEGVLMGNPSLAHVAGSPEDVPSLFAAASKVLKVNEAISQARSIGDYAFASSALTHIILAPGLSEIGEGAFANCKDLQAIDANLLGDRIPSASDGAFCGKDAQEVTLYVATDSYDIWKADPFWGRFRIIAGPSGVDSVTTDSVIKIVPRKGSIQIESDVEITEVKAYGMGGDILYVSAGSGCSMEVDCSGWGERMAIVVVSSSAATHTATVLLP